MKQILKILLGTISTSFTVVSSIGCSCTFDNGGGGGNNNDAPQIAFLNSVSKELNEKNIIFSIFQKSNTNLITANAFLQACKEALSDDLKQSSYWNILTIKPTDEINNLSPGDSIMTTLTFYLNAFTASSPETTINIIVHDALLLVAEKMSPFLAKPINQVKPNEDDYKNISDQVALFEIPVSFKTLFIKYNNCDFSTLQNIIPGNEDPFWKYFTNIDFSQTDPEKTIENDALEINLGFISLMSNYFFDTIKVPVGDYIFNNCTFYFTREIITGQKLFEIDNKKHNYLRLSFSITSKSTGNSINLPWLTFVFTD